MMIQRLGVTWYQNGEKLRSGVPYPNQWDWLWRYEPVVEVDFHLGPEELLEYLIREGPRGLYSGDDVTDEHVVWLSEFPDLRRVDLSRTSVTNRGLAPLANLSELESLDLSGTRVSNDGLRHLPVDSLRELNLSGTLIDDDAVEWLNKCTHLELLTLGATYDPPEGRNRHTIPAARMGDAGLLRLKCPALKSLNLRGTAVTNAGLEYVGKFKGLQILNLVNTSINDEGLRSLCGLESLRELHLVEEVPVMMFDPAVGPPLTKTSATASGVEALKDAMPHVQIIYGFRAPELEFVLPSWNR